MKKAFPKFYSLPEAAAVMDVNVHTLKQQVQRGQVAAEMFGRVYFLSPDDIFNYLSERDPEKARKFAESESLFEE